MTVPATPKKEATTAADTAARADAATWTALSGRLGAAGRASVRAAVSGVRGEVMSSERSASSGRARGRDGGRSRGSAGPPRYDAGRVTAGTRARSAGV